MKPVSMHLAHTIIRCLLMASLLLLPAQYAGAASSAQHDMAGHACCDAAAAQPGDEGPCVDGACLWLAAGCGTAHVAAAISALVVAGAAARAGGGYAGSPPDRLRSRYPSSIYRPPIA